MRGEMMKRISVLFLTGIIVLMFSGISFGEEYIYSTTAFDGSSPYYGLDHDKAYSWDIDLSNDDSENNFTTDTGTIDSVTLVFNDIRENTGNGDILQISVLDPDDANDGIATYTDNENPSNYFTDTNRRNRPYFKDDDNDGSTAELLFTLKDVSPYWGNQISVTYNNSGSSNITRVGDQSVPWETYSGNVINALTDYISENVLTIGLDPDCHYYARSISLILNTSDTPGGVSHTPEPETLVLFGFGLLGLSAFGRKRFSSMG